MKVLAAEPAGRADRPASAVLYDHAHARVIGFHLLPGQSVPEHRSDSTVTIHVLEGSGTFRGSSGAATLHPGQVAVYEAGEPHAMAAGAEPLRFLAIITPRPG
ncbi:MAG TPA: cupin domain-containing protein [Longimicrobiales bacterium]